MTARRRAQWYALVAFAILIASSGLARAQSLQRLTITQFTLSADTDAPRLEVPFHLIITVHVQQQIGELNTLDLPVLTSLELLGDERGLTSSASGTLYRESITVVAHHTGRVQIAPATLDAIDARDGKPKRYFSNPLVLTVQGGTLQPFAGAGTAIVGALLWLLRALMVLVGLACAAIVAALLFRRRREHQATPTPDVVAPMPAPEPARSDRERWMEILSKLRADPSRSGAILARSASRAMVGASDSQTLADVLTRTGASDHRIGRVLRTLERAAFTYDADLPSALHAAIDALEQVTE